MTEFGGLQHSRSTAPTWPWFCMLCTHMPRCPILSPTTTKMVMNALHTHVSSLITVTNSIHNYQQHPMKPITITPSPNDCQITSLKLHLCNTDIGRRSFDHTTLNFNIISLTKSLNQCYPCVKHQKLLPIAQQQQMASTYFSKLLSYRQCLGNYNLNLAESIHIPNYKLPSGLICDMAPTQYTIRSLINSLIRYLSKSKLITLQNYCLYITMGKSKKKLLFTRGMTKERGGEGK